MNAILINHPIHIETLGGWTATVSYKPSFDAWKVFISSENSSIQSYHASRSEAMAYLNGAKTALQLVDVKK